MTFIEYAQLVFLPQFLNGLVLGMAVVLVALGMTIIFGLLDVINISHGEFYAIGGFLSVSLAAMGMNFWIILAMVPCLMLPLGAAVERVLIRQVFNRKDRHLSTLLLTFGLSTIIEDLLRQIYGANPFRPATPITGAIEIFGIYLPLYRMFLVGFGAIVILAVTLLIYRTRIGAMVRAAAYDRNMAASMGLPVSLIYSGTFAVGVALAGLAGALLGPVYSVFPTMGVDFLELSFAVVIVGGIGSVFGTVVAGLLLAQVQTLSSLFLSPVWAEPIVFTAMVLFLIFRPNGLFGRIGHA
jgi:branched-chain amino acid transport system permease protein